MSRKPLIIPNKCHSNYNMFIKTYKNVLLYIKHSSYYKLYVEYDVKSFLHRNQKYFREKVQYYNLHFIMNDLCRKKITLDSKLKLSIKYY